MAKNLAFFAWLVFIVALTACSKTPAAQSTPDTGATPSASPALPTNIPATPTETSPAGTIAIWHAWDESELPALVTIISAFQQENPDIYFDVLAIPESDLLVRYKVETRQGSGPDILLGPADWADELFEAGLVQDLAPLAQPLTLENLNQAALRFAEDGASLPSMPYSLHGVVLYRNKEVSTLKADSLEELISLAQTAAYGEVLGAYFERSFFFSGAHLNGMGGMLFDPTGNPAFNTPAGLSWIELLKAFESAGPTSFQSDDDLQAFLEGRVGWIIDGTWNLPLLVETVGTDKLAIDPWPVYGPGRLSGYVQSENVYLSSKAQERGQRPALQFIEFLLSAQAQTTLAEIGRIPALTTIDLEKTGSGPLIQQAIAAMRDGTAYPSSPYLNLYEVEIDSALKSIFEGSNPPAALQTAQENILSELSAEQPALTPTP